MKNISTQLLASLDAANARVEAERRRILRESGRLAAQTRKPILAALIARRRELGLTVTVVATRMGVPRPAVARLESAARKANPTLDTLIRYASAVGATLRVEPVHGEWREPRLEF